MTTLWMPFPFWIQDILTVPLKLSCIYDAKYFTFLPFFEWIDFRMLGDLRNFLKILYLLYLFSTSIYMILVCFCIQGFPFLNFFKQIRFHLFESIWLCEFTISQMHADTSMHFEKIYIKRWPIYNRWCQSGLQPLSLYSMPHILRHDGYRWW